MADKFKVKTMNVHLNEDGTATVTVGEVEKIEGWGSYPTMTPEDIKQLQQNPKPYTKGDTLIIDENGMRYVDPNGKDVTDRYNPDIEVMVQTFGAPLLEEIMK